MNTLTISDFRKSMSSSLNRIDEGERIYIRRGELLYTVLAVHDYEEFTPKLYEEIRKGRICRREVC